MAEREGFSVPLAGCNQFRSPSEVGEAPTNTNHSARLLIPSELWQRRSPDPCEICTAVG